MQVVLSVIGLLVVAIILGWSVRGALRDKRADAPRISLDAAIERAMQYEVFETDNGPPEAVRMRKQIADGRFGTLPSVAARSMP
jgi:hypothetical protein